jgi:hypothetical protein
MRRALRLLCLAVALVVAVLGSKTVSAQVKDAPPVPARRLRLGPPGDPADSPKMTHVGSGRGVLYAVEASTF